MIIYNNLGYEILDVQVDDNSYSNKAIMGDHNLLLHYSLPEHVEIPIGSYCLFQNETYTLERPENFKMKHSRNFEYTVLFDSYQSRGRKWKFRNIVDGRLKFSLTATPREHLQMFVDNMNSRDNGWTVGDCIEGTEKLISYNHAYCSDALIQIASQFKTEYEYEGKRVSLHKVEYNKNSPLPLAYGRGNGFKPGVGRTNSGSTPPIEILFVQGGSENIDPSKYGHSELLLPPLQTIAYDGVHFEGEQGFIRANARNYVVDDLGISIRRYDKQLSSLAEDSLDCSEIYPKRVGQVSSVINVDPEHNFYDFTDTSIPDNLDYGECLIEGETMTVIFQSGMLAGREFEVKYFHGIVENKPARRFEIVPAEIDGQTMPNATFKPIAGNSYVVYKCMLPDSYICDDETRTGASWDMFRAAVKYLFDNEEEKFSFTGELDGIWAKNNWLNVGGRIKLGRFVFFSDAHFQPEGVLIRITGIKTFINKPHSPVITLSNTTVTESVSSTLKDLKSEEVIVEDLHNNALQFTKRRFRDAQETIGMLEAALLENFTNSVNPIAVRTMLMLVGDESLQFRFVNNKTDPQPVTHNIVYDKDTKQLTAEDGILQHMTLGIDTLSSQHTTDEYLFWDIEAYESGQLETAETKYYLYAKVEKNGHSGSFILSEEAIGMYDVSGYYHLLVGVLNSEYNGERSFVTLYGFTEILPGRVTTDRIVSANGNTYFDLEQGEIGGKIKFGNGSSGYSNISDRPDLGDFLTNTDGLFEIFSNDYIPTLSNEPAMDWTSEQLKKEHNGDLFRRNDGGTDEWYRFVKVSTTLRSSVYEWKWIRVENRPAWFDYLESASKMWINVIPSPPYSVGDVWLNGAIFLNCIRGKTHNEIFNDADWDDAEIYDCTQTTIDGGLITSGRIQLGDENGEIKAGIDGAGDNDDSVRFWAGDTYMNRNQAAFCVKQSGKVIIGRGSTMFNEDGSGYLSNCGIEWDSQGNLFLNDVYASGCLNINNYVNFFPQLISDSVVLKKNAIEGEMPFYRFFILDGGGGTVTLPADATDGDLVTFIAVNTSSSVVWHFFNPFNGFGNGFNGTLPFTTMNGRTTICVTLFFYQHKWYQI